MQVDPNNTVRPDDCSDLLEIRCRITLLIRDVQYIPIYGAPESWNTNRNERGSGRHDSEQHRSLRHDGRFIAKIRNPAQGIGEESAYNLIGDPSMFECIE